jgi:hypothetical protein
LTGDGKTVTRVKVRFTAAKGRAMARRKQAKWYSAAVFFAALAASGVAAASAAAAGVPAQIRAIASPYMPTVSRVQLQAAEATDTDQQIAQAIRAALAARGISVDDTAPLILTYDTQISSETASRAAGSEPTVDLSELGAPGDSAEMGVPLDVGPQFGDAIPGALPQAVTIEAGSGGMVEGGGLVTPAGILPEMPAVATDPAGGEQPYSLVFTLGMDGAPPIWTGSITARLPEQNPIAVGRFLAAPLIAAIGKSGRANIVVTNPGPR